MSRLLPRLIAVGLCYIAGTAFNAALHVPGLSIGYALFGLVFVGIAIGVWKVTTVREGPEGAGPRARSGCSGPSSSAAAALKGAERPATGQT